MIPNLASNEVHAWCVRLDVPRDVAEGLAAALSPEERNRAARFQLDRDRRRFAVARGVLRDLLGRYVGARPGDVRFVHNKFGKPALGPEFGRRPRFNLSHSADLALVAIAADADVGVDVECVRAGVDYYDIAKRFFAAEELEEWIRVPSHLHAEGFLRVWTQKEAYMKARGEGFEIPPESFSVFDLDGSWSVHELQPAPGYVGALAVESRGRRINLHQWQGADAIVA